MSFCCLSLLSFFCTLSQSHTHTSKLLFMQKITVYHAGVCFRAISRYRLWNAKPWLLGESERPRELGQGLPSTGFCNGGTLMSSWDKSIRSTLPKLSTHSENGILDRRAIYSMVTEIFMNSGLEVNPNSLRL